MSYSGVYLRLLNSEEQACSAFAQMQLSTNQFPALKSVLRTMMRENAPDDVTDVQTYSESILAQATDAISHAQSGFHPYFESRGSLSDAFLCAIALKSCPLAAGPTIKAMSNRSNSHWNTIRDAKYVIDEIGAFTTGKIPNSMVFAGLSREARLLTEIWATQLCHEAQRSLSGTQSRMFDQSTDAKHIFYMAAYYRPLLQDSQTDQGLKFRAAMSDLEAACKTRFPLPERDNVTRLAVPFRAPSPASA